MSNGSVNGSMPVAIYTLSISGKSDNVQAKELQAEMTAEKGAGQDGIVALVNVLPKVYTKPITSVGGQIRNYFNKNGIQLGKTVYGIPISILPKFKSELDKMIQEYKLHVSKLVAIAETGELRDIVIKQAGDCADEIANKIPDADKIRNGFDVDVRVHVNFDDANVGKALQILSDDVRDQLRKEVEESAKKDDADKVNAVTAKVVDAVKDLIQDIQKRCTRNSDEKTVQYKTMIDRVKYIVDVLPAYNVLANPELDKMIEVVKEKFGKLDKDTLKENATVRDTVVKDAKEIATAFAKMF